MSGLAANVEDDALLSGVVPPVVQAAVGIDHVVDEGPAPACRAPAGWLDLDHARASVGQELARPLVAAIGKLDDREAVVHSPHICLLFMNHAQRRARPAGRRGPAALLRGAVPDPGKQPRVEDIGDRVHQQQVSTITVPPSRLT